MASRKTQPGALSAKLLKELNADFVNSAQAVRMHNAVAETPVTKLALRRSVVTETDHSFSIHLDSWQVTNQKSSGRCWLFAGLNLFRTGAMKKMKLKNFEFSQNHALFWDKMERANHFMENIVATRKLDVADREVAFLLSDPIGDGGQWNMFINVIRKHGAVPKSAMPETQSSSSTRLMNRTLQEKLREAARDLRSMAASGADLRKLRNEKDKRLNTIYRILCIHLGTPPCSFDWQWKDKDGKFHRDGKMTPRQFAKKYITVPMDDYVCLVHDPRRGHAFGKTYTIKFLGNVVGGAPVIYLNVDIATMKQQALKALRAKEPVWMGCDVGKQMHGSYGIWDANLYDLDSVYNTEFTMTKADRLVYHQTQMTHAMLFTGVDVVGRKPRRWRVENSWGSDKGRGQKGFYTMNDSWFDEYMFEIAARKSRLPAKLQTALKKPPRVLPPWDPMGSLAV